MILTPTIIPNTSRTIVGLGNFVFNGDTFIQCNTTPGPVSITLLELTPGFLNTAYKLYIVDSGNAGVNNITINAPIGYSINGQASLTINVNSGICLITISSNTSYLATFSFSGSGTSISVVNEQSPNILAPVTLTSALNKLTFQGLQSVVSGNDVTLFNAFISVTNAQLQTLITGNDLIPNQGYAITNANYGNETKTAYILATSQNSIGNSGFGRFFNADYNNVGNYSGIPGFAGQNGIWGGSLIPAINSVCIWNNKHFLNTTGLNGVNNPSVDLVNWSVLTESVTNGYLIAVDSVTFDPNANRITSRTDNKNNLVTDVKAGPVSSLNLFKFGDSIVRENKVVNSIFYNCNAVFNSFCVANNLTNARIILGDGINIGGSFDEFSKNVIINNDSGNLLFGGTISSNTFVVKNNSFIETTGTIDGLGTMEKNQLFDCSIILQNGFIFNNNIISNSTVQVSNGASGRINLNTFENSFFGIQSNDSLISNNVISNSTLSIQVLNSGDIIANKLSIDSTIQIQSNLAPGKIVYNELTNQSQIIIGQQNSEIGNANEGNFLSNSKILIDNNSAQINKNKMFDSLIEINNNSGAIAGNFVQNGSSIRSDVNNGQFQNLLLVQSAFGLLTYTNNDNFLTGVYQKGNLSISVVLDCSNPLIYDLATTTLTIPIELNQFSGIITLVNANALVITNILGTSDLGEITFFNSPGETTTFTTTSVGAIIPAGELVSGLAPTPYNIILIGRTAGSDNFKSIKKSGVNQITEVNIFV